MHSDVPSLSARIDRLTDHVNREVGVAQDVPLHTRVDIQKEYFEGGGCRVPLGKFAFNLICPTALRELAKIYEEGEQKYPFDDPKILGSTWLRGLPFSNTINHMQNHLQIALMGGDQEGGPVVHLAKVAWNAFALIHFLSKCKHHRSALQLQSWTEQGWDGDYGKGRK